MQRSANDLLPLSQLLISNCFYLSLRALDTWHGNLVTCRRSVPPPVINRGPTAYVPCFPACALCRLRSRGWWYTLFGVSQLVQFKHLDSILPRPLRDALECHIRVHSFENPCDPTNCARLVPPFNRLSVDEPLWFCVWRKVQ